ncbi:DUF4832 domain-containing protein [Planctomycetota bacterium]
MKTLHIHTRMTLLRTLLFVGAFVSGAIAVQAQITYPYKFTYNGNPLSRNHGAADPDAHVWDGTVWVYCSQDHEGGYSNMDGYHAFSSTDMIHWTDHGDVFNSSMLDEGRWGSTPDHWMWAPGAARKQDENGDWTYYLYYPHNVRLDGEDWVTGVATAPTPAGPFTDQGPLRGGEMGMDPMVFVDEDGQAYIYSNSLIVARLNPDMMSLAESPRKIAYAPDWVLNDNTLRFGEGSYMHKKDGVYYYSYSNFHNKDYQAFYATGDNPYGPFQWQGPMAPHPQGAQDHHSLIDFKGQWYYFYHIAVPDIPENKDGQGRIVCFDRLYYNQDGSIQTVVHTDGPTHVLRTSVPHGTITLDPPGGAYAPGTIVTLTATGDLGYAFTAWGGDLSGSKNPVSITMDSDKSVSASYVEVSIYTLSSQTTHGTIERNPSGDAYSKGVVVTLTPVADFGYDFDSWSGDLSGSQNPAKIVIDAEKSVAARFISIPTYRVTTKADHGLIELDPSGGHYEAGTSVTVTPKPHFGFTLSKWGGDLSGNKRSETLTIDSGKTISAEFVLLPAEKSPWREAFTFPDKTQSDTGSTSWRVTRPKGLFEVRDNRLVINKEGGEGVFVSGVIDISDGPVNISLDLWSVGGLDGSDYVKLYKIVDGGDETLVGSMQDKIEDPSTIKGNAVGKNLVLVVRAKVTADDEFYYMDNLSVTYDYGGTTTVGYTADLTSVFPNPERGWHNRRDVDGRGGDDDRDFSDVKAAGHTLVHSYLRLDDYRDTDMLPQSYLDDLQEALDAVRTYGLKLIPRPSHVWSSSPSVSESRILGHIEQINAVLSDNADVVCHLETGYLGKWGEWHSGRYTQLSNQSEGDTRYRIVKQILDTTPDTIPIAMRYPMHIREILDELRGSEPLTQVQRDRLGHHNDCFLYNDNDRGTYARNDLWFGNQTLEQQKQYTFDLITSYGGNKIMGGETCASAIDGIDGTQIHMAEANWTEININFWGDAIDMWKNRWLPASGNDPVESEFDRISRKLGYRLRLIDATFLSSATAGSSFSIAANLSNDGYAGVVKPRPIYLVFDNGTDRTNIELSNVDVRTWVSGPVVLSPQTVTLPSDMAPGTYRLALWLPDAAANLHARPAYSIRFANQDVWDTTKGYNVLSDSVTIHP